MREEGDLFSQLFPEKEFPEFRASLTAWRCLKRVLPPEIQVQIQAAIVRDDVLELRVSSPTVAEYLRRYFTAIQEALAAQSLPLKRLSCRIV